MESRRNDEQRIVELESNLERSALYGKQLLDQLTLKSNECEELLKQSTQFEIELDSLKQKLHSAEKEIEFAAVRERNALKEIEELQDVCTKYEALQRDNKALEGKFRLLESEKQRRLQTVAELEEHLQEARTELSIAKNQIEEFKLLEKQREPLTKEPTESRNDDIDGNDDDQDDDYSTVTIAELQTELNNLRDILKQNVEEKELAVRNNRHNEIKLEEAIEEKISIERELAFLSNAINDKSRQISELKEEIEVLKAAETDPNRRGNSIFAEVEDRRIEVEKTLLETRARLRFAEENQRRLRGQLAQCYTSLQVMATHVSKADQNYVKTLEKEVIRLRDELSALATRVANSVQEGEEYTEKDLQDNPLAGMLLSERRQSAAYKKKIDDLIRHEGKRTEDMLRLSSELRVAQSEVEKLGKERTILLMKLKEKQITERGGEIPSPGTQVEVIKEVLSEVVEETERTKLNEKKLLESGKIEEPVDDVENAEAAGITEPQTFREELACGNDQFPAVKKEETPEVKTVKFGEDAGTEKPRQGPKVKGRQVTVKRTKPDNNDCKAQ